MPTATGQMMRSCPTMCESSTIQSGTVATSSAANPDEMYCSPKLTPPLPPASSSPPTISAASHCRRPGRSVPSTSPRRIEKMYSSTPAMRKRIDAISSGGIVSIAIRIAR